MESRFKFGSIAAGILLSAFSGAVYAASPAGEAALPTAASFYTGDLKLSNAPSFNPPPLLLAANDVDAVQGPSGMTPATPAAAFQPPWISGRKAHQYLGLGTVMFAGLTALAAPGEKEGGSKNAPRQTSGTTHTRFARTTAALAVATVVTGLWYHWDDFHLEDGFADPDNQHVMLAGTGALMMLYAIHKSATSTVPTSHAALAEAGAATMLVAIKLTW